MRIRSVNCFTDTCPMCRCLICRCQRLSISFFYLQIFYLQIFYLQIFYLHIFLTADFFNRRLFLRYITIISLAAYHRRSPDCRRKISSARRIISGCFSWHTNQSSLSNISHACSNNFFSPAASGLLRLRRFSPCTIPASS